MRDFTQKQVKTGKGIVIFITFPSVPHEIINKERGFEAKYYRPEGEEESRCRKLSSQGQHIASLHGMDEEKWKEIVDTSDRHPELFIDYTEESTRYAYLLDTATKSGKSLLRKYDVPDKPLHTHVFFVANK